MGYQTATTNHAVQENNKGKTMSVVMHNQIQIEADRERVFDYVTQPWLWHEWHPNSKSAKAAVDRLQVGDTFDEVIAVQPLAPLPPRLIRQTHYVVEECVPNSIWQVRGDTGDGWLVIRYELEAVTTAEGEQTRFKRTLSFDVSGLTRLLLPALKRQMLKTSVQALENLRRKLEAV